MAAPTDADLYLGEILPLDEHMAVVRIITAAFFAKKNPGFAGDEGQLNSARMIITQS